MRNVRSLPASATWTLPAASVATLTGRWTLRCRVIPKRRSEEVIRPPPLEGHRDGTDSSSHGLDPMRGKRIRQANERGTACLARPLRYHRALAAKVNLPRLRRELIYSASS